MHTLHRSTAPTAPVIKVLGLGGAGGNALDHLVADGTEGTGIIALNTDVQALNACAAPQKIQLGHAATRGLGAGGDPEVGYTAADEAAEEINTAIEGADLIFLCAGLGGGTGSGAAPLIAHMARNAGALVIAFATMPFAFEGKRRRTQATAALAQLEEQADLVLCFENDRLGETASHKAGVQDAFLAADQMLADSIAAIAALVRRGGIIPTRLDALAAALRRTNARCLFGHGEGEGPHRAHDALARALKSPLMDKGRLLADCHSVIIHIAGGPDLTVQEITAVMEEFHQHIGDDTRIDFGLGTDAKLGRKVTITIISSTGDPLPAAAPAPRTLPRTTPAPAQPQRAAAPLAHEAADFEPQEEDTEPEPAEPAKTAPAQTYRKTPAAKTTTTRKKEEKAEQMTLEPANRGRFEKSEPTIVDGQDLDVPTFLRKNVKVK